ncbi:hypothetical protein QNH48_23715 [Neobacillus sp. YX16]|uniref:hypothetical protein n=1 Tax=Neobacillus sp. YX16 TaxID=3047874 RepID=UPI0024C2BA14|nr:hypothetical protein [Neobacillus sp. YX16]WHZ01956.1 hypothetical protein QNH48_23715 [Neobacillus sp. YX16]
MEKFASKIRFPASKAFMAHHHLQLKVSIPCIFLFQEGFLVSEGEIFFKMERIEALDRKIMFNNDKN